MCSSDLHCHRNNRAMRAVRHIPIIPMAMLAPVASRPRIMAPHRAIISTIRTLPRLHRNMTRRPRPHRRIPKARAKSASPIITPRKRRCVSRNFRRQSRLPLSPLSLPCSAPLRLRDSSCSAAPPRPNRQRSKKRTTTSTWTSTPSRATPTTETTSSEGRGRLQKPATRYGSKSPAIKMGRYSTSPSR